METKHSRAPWSIEPSSLGGDGNPLWYYIIDADGKIVATTWSKNQNGNAISDARLMAAAPNMLDLLRVCSAAFKADGLTEHNKRDAAKLIDAMIVFAEGGAQ